jgi:hypothetical protein
VKLSSCFLPADLVGSPNTIALPPTALPDPQITRPKRGGQWRFFHCE